MTNYLTGDYDVVVQLSLDAVNRVSAALHSVERFPHSLSLAVDDRQNSTLGTIALNIVDTLGTPVANPTLVRVGPALAASMARKLSSDLLNNVDPIVNLHPINVSVQLPQYSNVYGVAQVQLGPPVMQLPAGSTTQAEIHTPAMIRYFADTSDPKTDPLSPFLRGEVVTTFAIKTVSSTAGTNIVVDLAGPGGNVHFNPAWSAGPLNANDRNAIDLAMAKILTRSFQPSSTPRPSTLLALDFKGFPASSAVAMLMNVTTQNIPTPDSVQNVFLNADDQFALALNGDVIVGTLLGNVRENIPKSETVVITVNWQIGFFSGTFHVTVSFSVGIITVELLDDVSTGVWDADTAIQSAGIPGRGVIRVTVPAQVTFSSNDMPPTIGLPSSPVDVTLSQLFTLSLTDGAVQGIQTIGGWTWR